MPDFQLKTPVALVIFNRPETTERVFAEIAKAKPPKLLLIGDGPRPGRAGEAEKVAATRAIVELINWDCVVLKSFSEVNLGCRMRVKTGIDWVFQQVEEAIILEDDCLPHPSFFRFCEETLAKYRQDQRIAFVSGDSFLSEGNIGDESYFFSRYSSIWGWATWRNRWQDNNDINMEKWPIVRDSGWLENIYGSKEEALYWAQGFQSVYAGKIDTWDYQWGFACLSQSRLGITPKVNLISNIGFGVDSTHTSTESSGFANLPTEEMLFPLKHPDFIIRNYKADKLIFRHCYKPPLLKRVGNKLVRIIGKLK